MRLADDGSLGSFPLLSPCGMPSEHDQLRLRVVQFFNTHRQRGKCFTVRHFVEEGLSRRTIYHILQKYEERGNCERKPGSGRQAEIMTPKVVKRIKTKLLSSKPPSTRSLARTIGCSQQHVCKTIHRKTNLQFRKKRKGPAYSPEEEAKCRSTCRRLYALSSGKDFVLDDEKYFTLSGAHMPGNRFYYTDG